MLPAVQTATCSSTISTSCLAAFATQRHRALAQTATIIITRALASNELVKAVPLLSAAELAVAGRIDGVVARVAQISRVVTPLRILARQTPDRSWRRHDIAITNIVLFTAYKRGVGGGGVNCTMVVQ